MFCGIVFVPLVLRISCLFNFKCTFQGLTSQRPKLKHTYHKGVQHMHSSWKLHCDMKDIQTLHVILKMSKPWPFRCPTWGKRIHVPQNCKLLNHGSQILKPLIPTELKMFDDVCDCENEAQCWIGGGWLPGGCEPVQEPLSSNTRCDQGRYRTQGQAALTFSQPPSSSSTCYSGSEIRIWWLPMTWKFYLVVCRLRRAGHALCKELFDWL